MEAGLVSIVGIYDRSPCFKRQGNSRWNSSCRWISKWTCESVSQRNGNTHRIAGCSGIWTSTALYQPPSGWIWCRSVILTSLQKQTLTFSIPLHSAGKKQKLKWRPAGYYLLLLTTLSLYFQHPTKASQSLWMPSSEMTFFHPLSLCKVGQDGTKRTPGLSWPHVVFHSFCIIYSLILPVLRELFYGNR